MGAALNHSIFLIRHNAKTSPSRSDDHLGLSIPVDTSVARELRARIMLAFLHLTLAVAGEQLFLHWRNHGIK